MRKLVLLALAAAACFSSSAIAQQGQTSDVNFTEPLIHDNSFWVQGLAPGYWPTCTNSGALATCSGLTLYLTSGTVWCQGTIRNYAGGTLTLTNNATNYVYLDPTANCAPAASTSTFTATQVPIAVVVTASGAITTITDDRSWLDDLSSAQLSDGATLATKAGVQDESYTCAADTGAANAYAISVSPAPTVGTYSEFCFKAANANTGASTLAVNGASAVTITRKDGTALQSGDIPSGSITTVKFDGTNYQCATCASSGGATINFVDHETPSGSINGSNVTFTLANTPTSGSEICKLNGVSQRSGSGNDYTISGATITYLAAPQTGDTLDCSYRH